MITDRTRLIDVTVGDFIGYLKECGLVGQQKEAVQYSGPETVTGLDGLAQLLGCSKGTASRRKQSGEFDEAISQTGRKIVVDVRKLLEITNIAKMSKVKRR